jgi:hypothetical protein
MMTNEDKIFLENIKEQVLKRYPVVRIKLLKIDNKKVVSVETLDEEYDKFIKEKLKDEQHIDHIDDRIHRRV